MCHLQSSPPTLPILNQPAVPSTQLGEIRRGEKRRECRRMKSEKKIRLFSFQHLLSQLGNKIWAIHQAPCCCPQVFNSLKGHSVNTTITNSFLASFSRWSDASQTVQNHYKHCRCLSALHLSLLCLIAWGTLLKFYLGQGVKVSHWVVK